VSAGDLRLSAVSGVVTAGGVMTQRKEWVAAPLLKLARSADPLLPIHEEAIGQVRSWGRQVRLSAG